MGKSKRLIVLILVLGCSTLASAQNRYMVFFTDKDNTQYTVDNPEEFLSLKAINRTNREAISTHDFPVNPEYLLGLKMEGITVLYATKWMNGALVEATDSQLESLNLAYVSHYSFVAPNRKPASEGRIENPAGNGRLELTFVQNELLKLSKMHEDGFTGKGIRIAVLDAGFDGVDKNAYLKHVFEDNRLIMTYDFVRKSEHVYSYHSHGGNVFSIFGSFLESSYIGGGYGADFDLFITEDDESEYKIEEYNWLIAAEKADSAGVDIITTSLGYYDFDDSSMDYVQSDLDGKTAVITQAAEMAFSKGILVITSAGNEGRPSNSWHAITFPADAANIIAVGAVYNDDIHTATVFSSPGPTSDGRVKPDIVAVGDSTTYINSSSVLTNGNGTSYSTPLIAGLAAGLWQKYPELSNKELKDLIIESGDNYLDPNNNIGHGMPSYIRASSIKEGTFTGIGNKYFNEFIIYPNPVTCGFISFHADPNLGSSHIEIINIHGQKIKEVEVDQIDNLKMDIANLKPGVYRVIVKNSLNLYQSTLIIE